MDNSASAADLRHLSTASASRRSSVRLPDRLPALSAENPTVVGPRCLLALVKDGLVRSIRCAPQRPDIGTYAARGCVRPPPVVRVRRTMVRPAPGGFLVRIAGDKIVQLSGGAARSLPNSPTCPAQAPWSA